MTAALSTGVLLADASTVLPSWHEDLAAVLLMVLLGMALGVALTAVLIVMHRAHRRPRAARVTNPLRSTHRRSAHGPRTTFALRFRWLAVRNSDAAAVHQALRLQHTASCTWEEGLRAASHDLTFIAPPVNGWTLVFGASLPEPAQDVDRCFHFLTRLGRTLGHVQFFSFDRTLNQHAWIVIEQGVVCRAYAWAGRTLWNQGVITAAERELGLRCFEYAEDAGSVEAVRPIIRLNTERVPLLAARWSLSPAAIDTRRLRDARGIAGQISPSRTY